MDFNQLFDLLEKHHIGKRIKVVYYHEKLKTDRTETGTLVHIGYEQMFLTLILSNGARCEIKSGNIKAIYFENSPLFDKA